MKTPQKSPKIQKKRLFIVSSKFYEKCVTNSKIGVDTIKDFFRFGYRKRKTLKIQKPKLTEYIMFRGVS